MINLLIHPDMVALDYGLELVSVQYLFTPSLLACSILDTRDYAKGNPSTPLEPWYITGLVDGEGNFSINATTRNGKPKIDFSFKVTQTGRNA
jgi:hypothetical protein